jgi:hypothetical protein
VIAWALHALLSLWNYYTNPIGTPPPRYAPPSTSSNASAAAVSSSPNNPGNASMADTLQPGDLVTYTAHPEWGTGIIRFRDTDTGLLFADFELDGGPYSDVFHPGEFTRARPLITRTA